MENASLRSINRVLATFSVMLLWGLSWHADPVLASKRAGSEATASGPATSRLINKLEIRRGNEDVVVVVQADGVLQYDVTELDRNRLVIDLPNTTVVRDLSTSIPGQHALLKEIRIGRYPKKVRLVLDRRMPTQYRIEPGPRTVAITLASTAPRVSHGAVHVNDAAVRNSMGGNARVFPASPELNPVTPNVLVAAQPAAPTDATPPLSQSDATPSRRQSSRSSQSTVPPDVAQENTGPERYVAVFGGVTLSPDATNNRGTGPLSGVTLNDLDLARSGVVGLKAGAFPLGEKSWIGMETELFYTNPHVKEQNVTATGPGGSVTATFPGTHVRVTTLAFNLLVRYPGTVIQPYLGAGFGMFWGRISGGLGTGSDTSPGFNGLAGLRIRLMKHLAAFGEYKYNRTNFDFGGDVHVHTLYQAHHVVGGVAFEF